MIAPQSRWFVVLLGALMMINALSIDMILPALPALGETLRASPDAVQLTLSFYLVGYAAGQFVVGPLSDRFGRRRVLLSGLSVYALASVGCALSREIELLVAWRTMQGLVACAGPVVVRAIVRDHVGGDRAAHMMSSLTTVFAAGPLLAPLLGGVMVTRFGWPSVFLFIAFWTAVLVALAWAALGESLPEPDRDALRPARLAANFRAFLTTRGVLGFAVLNGFCWIGIFAFLSASPFVLIEHYGVPADHYGFYFGWLAVTLVVGASLNKRLLRRRPGLRVMRWGVALLVVGGAATLVVPLTPLSGPVPVLVSVMLYCLGQPLVMPNAVAAALDPLKHMAGMASALMGVVQMLCGAAGGYVVNLLYDGTPLPMGAVMFGAGLGCAAVYWLLRPARA